MKIIYTMAGNGTRFKNEGYTEEKYLIKAFGKTLFEYSVESLISFNNSDNEFVFIGRADKNFKDDIEPLIKKIGLKNYNFVSILGTTSGQAETLYKYTKNIKNEEVLVFNIDTMVLPGVLNPDDISGDMWWLTANLKGEKWSFVKISGTEFTTSEKVRISDDASLGMYYFKNVEDFNKAFIANKNEVIDEWNETYIAPFYNYVKGEMKVKRIKESDFNTIGTPEELLAFKETYEPK